MTGVVPAEEPDGELPNVVRMVLYNRGFLTFDDAKEFLSTDASMLEDPNRLPDVPVAVNRLEMAYKAGEKVAVFGDFDSDGVTGTALLVKALTRYGLEAIPYIPHRVKDGHGLNSDAIHQLSHQDITLIITVDCGVSDIEPIEYARSLGIDTIVTDHHTVTGFLPNAIAVINPRAPGSIYGFEELTGAGMALKLAQALLSPKFGATWSEGLFELAAIGTIGDMAPLVKENRYIVHSGIQELRHTTNIGLRTLMHSAKIDPPYLTSESIGFSLGPRLNAAGRLDSALKSYQLLMATDSTVAQDLVSDLEDINQIRRELTNQGLEESRSMVMNFPNFENVILVGSQQFNPGILGLVASRLSAEFGLPAAVYSLESDRVIASCRSSQKFHWADALALCSDLLDRYGGHAQAAGFTCHPSKLEELQGRLISIANGAISSGKETPRGEIDAELPIGSLTNEIYDQLSAMEPFGIGNQKPIFLAKGILATGIKTMGQLGQHVRMEITQRGAAINGVAFNQNWPARTALADIVYTLDMNRWKGVSELRINILDYQLTDHHPGNSE